MLPRSPNSKDSLQKYRLPQPIPTPHDFLPLEQCHYAGIHHRMRQMKCNIRSTSGFTIDSADLRRLRTMATEVAFCGILYTSDIEVIGAVNRSDIDIPLTRCRGSLSTFIKSTEAGGKKNRSRE